MIFFIVGITYLLFYIKLYWLSTLSIVCGESSERNPLMNSFSLYLSIV